MKFLVSIVFLVSIFLQFEKGLGYKEYLFKNCETSGFCHRNRHFADSIKENPKYESKYAIDPQSIHSESEDFIVSGNILKEVAGIGEDIVLPFELSLLDKNNIRIKVDEEQRKNIKLRNKLVNVNRYNETPNWSFRSLNLSYKSKSGTKYSQHKNKLVIDYGTKLQYRAEVLYKPFKVVIYRGKEVQFILNDRNFLNYEHWRPESSNAAHLSNEETDFNMFHDDFHDARNDRIPLGPESIGLDFTLKGFKHVYGIPEHADDFNLKDTTDSDLPYRLFNVDIFEYETNSKMPMYGSIPFLMGLKPGVSIGLFWINSADTYVDIDKSSSDKDTKTHWISENGILDVMIMIAESPWEINESYGAITGYVQLPQLFALGYHQCRWNYNDEKDVLEINSLFDKHQIPYDVIWLDVEYADAKKYFTWQSEKFPDPERMLAELDHTGRNLVIIIDPHLKTDYHISDHVEKEGISINDPSNNTFHGQCWPGESVWIDTMNPNSQPFWDKQHEYSAENEFMGKLSTNIHIWNDMNEPSVFDGIETTSPRDNIHYGNWEHRSVHNVFGLTFHEATYNSMIKRLSTTDRQRPFILTRSYFAGSQRTAAMWSGDNMSKWEYLKVSIPMLLTSGVAGMPFGGADVGGFFGDPAKDLLTRWYQTGIWYPFFRAHAHIDSRRREPWVAGDPYTSIMRDAIRLRYSLLPIFYTSFYESSISGYPVLKPLFYETPDNLESYDIEDQFFLGDSGLLIKPITVEDANNVDIYLPDDEIYYDYTSGNISNTVRKFTGPGFISKSIGLSDIPILLKGGSIIAKKDRYRRSSKLMARDPYTLTVALDNSGKASGKLYIDDGETFNYERGEYANVYFRATSNSIKGEIRGQEGFVESLDDIFIEKIVVLSVKELSSIRIQQSGSQWESNCRCIDGNLIIENPKLKLNSEWTIEINDTKFTESNIKTPSKSSNKSSKLDTNSTSSLSSTTIIFTAIIALVIGIIFYKLRSGARA
ncbi:unnamed protein product [Debaryomyces tyrocola]|nr:unnamed protein product [Debaryomyces tyrocola]